MKSAKTISEFIELLKSRNLILTDEHKAEHFLFQNNYYRLSGYWRKYQINPDNGDNNFKKDTIFEEILVIYELDTLLRNVRSLVNLRNLCAHQARIWNRRLTVPVTDRNYLQKFGHSNLRSQWRIISILMLLVDEINQNDSYSKEILKLCEVNKEFYAGLIQPTL
jgi:abortive infection bacteriophage resistance protein